MQWVISIVFLVFWTVAATAQPTSRALQIESFDGFRLSGTHFDPGAAGHGILMLHQCNRRGDLTGFESLAPKLASAGFHVVTYDSRGFGESRSDRYPDYHSMANEIDEFVERDVEAALDVVRTLDGVRSGPVGVVAASCGTWKILPIAVRQTEIAALVSLSGVYLTVPAAEEAVPQLRDLPVLAIFTEDDGFGTPESMRGLFANSSHPASRLVVLKGGEHGTAIFQVHQELEAQIVEWLSVRMQSD